VLRCGLTGGIGSGKSTVAAGLRARGAALVDADEIARRVVEPGRPVLAALVEHFGPSVLRADGTLDRPSLARIAFADPDALGALNRITHPAIAQELAEQLDALEDEGGTRIAVVEIPLLDTQGRQRYRLDGVIVVDAPEELAVARLVEQRGLDERDARARVDAQMSRAQRRSLADLVVDNRGDRAALDAEIDRAWRWLRARCEDRSG
jgi:dephospho-CoA kinase